MPSNNLGGPRIASGQAAGQHTSSNDADNWLDGAITETLTIVCDSTTETLTATQFATNAVFKLTETSPAVGATITLNVPSTNALGQTLKRGHFTVINDTSEDVIVQVSGQSETPPTLNATQRSILVMDGTNVYVAVPSGSIGGDGADGTDPGILFTFDTSTVDSDPGPGILRADNANLSSATFLYIDDVDRSSNNVEAHLLTWDDSTNTVKGHLYLTRASDGRQTIFTTGAVTDASGYVKLAVTYVSGATSFTDEDPVSVQFYRVGNVGATGGGGWALAGAGNTATGVWQQSVDGSAASVEFTDLDAFTEILIIVRNVTKSASASLFYRVSTDNGVSFYSTSGDYVSITDAGVEAATVAAVIHQVSATAARSGWGHITANVAGSAVKMCRGGADHDTTTQGRLFVASSDVIDAVQIVPSAAADLNGGAIYCFGR